MGTDNRELVTDRLADLLAGLSEQATYQIHPEIEWSADQLRSLYASDIWGNWYTALTATTKLPDGMEESLIEEVHSAFGEYIVGDKIGIAAAILVGNGPIAYVTELAMTMVRAAALIGKERIATIIADWLSGTPIEYSANMIVAGIQPEQDLTVGEDIEVRRVRGGPNGLTPEVPPHVSRTFADSDHLSFLGTSKVTVRRILADSPPLFRPDQLPQPEQSQFEFEIAERLYMKAFVQALSLQCDSEVAPMIHWNDSGDLVAFNFGELGANAFAHREQYSPVLPYLSVEITQSHLDQAAVLLPKLKVESLVRLGSLQAIERWMKSKRWDTSFEDRFIELRIALESLFVDDSDQGELSFRLATRGGLLLGADGQQRKQYFQDLRKFYRLSSRAIHAGILTQNDESKETLEKGQNICREEILRRLHKDRKPDWDAVLFGVPEA